MAGRALQSKMKPLREVLVTVAPDANVDALGAFATGQRRDLDRARIEITADANHVWRIIDA